MNKENQYFKLFSCIKIVKGFKNGLLYDLQRKEYVQLPLDFCDVLIHQNQKILSINNLRNNQNPYIVEQLSDFITWLSENEFIFFCNNKIEFESFPEISTEWNSIDLLINSIIDIEDINRYNIHKAICNLHKINCHSIQFRFFCNTEIETLIKILNYTTDKSFQNIELILPYHEEFSNSLLKTISQEFPNLVSITFYRSPQNKFLNKNQLSVFFTSQMIISEKNCGNINKLTFACDLSYFKEACQFNICLNGKVAIDKNGQIRNCPSLPIIYGNINEVELDKVINSESFKQFWYINKDQIEVCKDCEFRYMCTDCRAYIKDPDNIYSQPAKCTYNPYIAKWQDEEGYVSIEECGTYSKETGFVVDIEKVEALNLELWDS